MPQRAKRRRSWIAACALLVSVVLTIPLSAHAYEVPARGAAGNATTLHASASRTVVDVRTGTATASFTVSGKINTAYRAAGGPSGSWGVPIMNAKTGLIEGGTVQQFTRGTAYANANTATATFTPLRGGAGEVAAAALSQIGYHKKFTDPLCQDTKYNRWAKDCRAWCAMFLAWASHAVGRPDAILLEPSFARFKEKMIAKYGKTLTPKPGDIMIWDGSGRETHAALVLAVSGDTVTVVDGNTSRTFPWNYRGVSQTKASRSWWRYFIPVNYGATLQRPLENTAPPLVSGTPTVGVKLSASRGSWQKTPETYSYRWFADGVAIPGAHSATFAPGWDQLGQRLTVSVTARLPGYEGTASSAATVRVAAAPGAQRYFGQDAAATAAAISRLTGKTGTRYLVVATRESYSDALSGGPLAGLRKAPLLLVARDRIPDVTLREIKRLQPQSILLLGGPKAVTKEVAAQLSALTPGKDARLAGADAYGTSAAVSAWNTRAGAEEVFVATGGDYADALSGAPAAVLSGAPILLVTRTTIPEPILTELQRIRPKRITILGGPLAVSAGVERQLRTLAAGGVRRLSGEDAYGTSAAVSRAAFPSGAETVYVATRSSFSDALAGGPAASAARGPLLLVSKDAIPQVIAAELERLAPKKIVVLGGPDVVSFRVQTVLSSYLAG